MQRNRTQESARAIYYIKMLELELKESTGDFREASLFRQSDRVSPNKVGHADFRQLGVEECSSFPFQRFTVHEAAFKNAAAIIAEHACHHQVGHNGVTECQLKHHQNSHDRCSAGSR